MALRMTIWSIQEWKATFPRCSGVVTDNPRLIDYLSKMERFSEIEPGIRTEIPLMNVQEASSSIPAQGWQFLQYA
jgi:hypothetical protein